MKFLGNIIWLLFGGLESAIGYFTASLSLAMTIVGIPWALQTFKIGLLCLWPFGAKVTKGDCPPGCLRIPLNLLWIVCGGLLSCVCHIVFGLVLSITLIGLPWGKQHFKMAGLSLTPFGRNIQLDF